MELKELLDEIESISKNLSKPLTKGAVLKELRKRFTLKRDRIIYSDDTIAIRLSEIKKKGYSNTFTSLRNLKKYNDKPIIACIVRPKYIELLLANLTFINRISHSSHKLEGNHLRGSANLSNIIKDYKGISNTPQNFGELFNKHQKICVEENIHRIVLSTKNIKTIGKKFTPSSEQIESILNSVERSTNFFKSDYKSIKGELDSKVNKIKDEILKAAEIDNVNLRGNKIEQLITGEMNEHKLDDVVYKVAGLVIYTDIKTKILNLHSSPKAYNLDKLLEILSDKNSVYCVYFILIDIEGKQVKTYLHSFLNSTLIEHTKFQFHWAGRESRGVAQFTDGFTKALTEKDFPNIDTEKASSFLSCIIGIKKSGL